MRRVAIIGSGASGLSAAYSLEKARRQGATLEYTVFESTPKIGGVLVTDRVDDCLVEGGPDSFISEKPWAADLCRELGIGDQLIGSNDPARKTYILIRGKLVAIPDGLMFMVPTRILPAVLSPLFSFGAKLRMAGEWFHPPHKANGDETVAELVERHYGKEMVDRLADPLLSGVYGGQASELSVRAVLPRFADMEAKHGSLGRAMLAARKNLPAAGKSAQRPLFTSLKNGMQQLVDVLVSQLPAACLRTSTAVRSLQRREGNWLVQTAVRTETFDSVIVAVPSRSAGAILQTVSAGLARELSETRYSSSVTVTLGYGREVLAQLPPGFGFLVPRSEGFRLLACTFVHTKFPHRAPPDRALIRTFLGGSQDEQVLSLSEDEILQLVRQELGRILKLQAEPRFARVYKWPSAMALYGVGHLEKLERIEKLRTELPALALAGNGYRGIGVPDCVRSGRDAASASLSSFGLPNS
jgi:protoporphyrinogen/coproporphyrinogen III oxidase